MTDEEIVRNINGETVLGYPVAAYRETGPTRFGTVYSEHWSTPNRKDPNITVERLFTEEQLRAALKAAQAEIERLREALIAAREAILSLRDTRWSEAEGTDDEWVGYIDYALSPLSPEKE